MARPLSARAVPSLATRVVLTSALVFAAPLAYLALSSIVETALASRTDARIEGCLRAVRDAPLDARREVASEVCARHRLRVRSLTIGAAPIVLSDALASRAIEDRIGDLFYGPERVEALAAYEAEHAPAERPEVRAALVASESRAHCDTIPSANLRVCGAAVRTAEGGVLHVVGSSRTAHDERYALRRQLVAMMALGAVLALGLLAWLRRLVTAPLARLAADVSTPASNGRRARLSEDRPRDLADVARAFNAVAADLERADVRHQAFLADLAHEMKSPVATVRAAADALEGPAGDAPEARREMAERARRSAVRLEQLLLQFLELSRTESPGNDRSTRVDLGPLAHGVVSSIVTPEDITVLTDLGSAPHLVEGDPERLESALRNLVDNACVFARANVRVCVRSAADHVEIRVADDGAGIAPGDRERIFDRFHSQRPKARAGGTGLGLAIVKAVAEAHRGTVEALDADLGGAELVIQLPRCRG